MKGTIANLPVELLLEIFKAVDDLNKYDEQTLLYRACLVSRRWYDALTSRLYRKPVLSSMEAINIFARTVRHRPELILHARSLDVEVSRYGVLQFGPNPLAVFPHYPSPAGLFAAMPLFKRLRDFSLHDDSSQWIFGHLLPWADPFQHLSTCVLNFHMRQKQRLTVMMWKDFLPWWQLPRLKSLMIVGASFSCRQQNQVDPPVELPMSSRLLAEAQPTDLSAVDFLGLENCNITYLDIDAVFQVRGVKTLSLRGSRYVGQLSLEMLPSADLVELDLTHFAKEMPFPLIRHMANLRALTTHASLLSVLMHSTVRIAPYELHTMRNLPENLESLTVEGMSWHLHEGHTRDFFWGMLSNSRRSQPRLRHLKLLFGYAHGPVVGTTDVYSWKVPRWGKERERNGWNQDLDKELRGWGDVVWLCHQLGIAFEMEPIPTNAEHSTLLREQSRLVPAPFQRRVEYP